MLFFFLFFHSNLYGKFSSVFLSHSRKFHVSIYFKIKCNKLFFFVCMLSVNKSALSRKRTKLDQFIVIQTIYWIKSYNQNHGISVKNSIFCRIFLRYRLTPGEKRVKRKRLLSKQTRERKFAQKKMKLNKIIIELKMTWHSINGK